MNNKKGLIGLNQLSGVIFILVIIGILLTVGLKIEHENKDAVDTTTISTTMINATLKSSINDSFTTYENPYPNTVGTGYIWKDPTAFRSCSLTVTEVNRRNETKFPITTGNYSVSNCRFTFISVSANDAHKYNNTLWNVTGTWTYPSDTTEYNVTADSEEALVNVSANQGLLGTIIVFGVIISLVMVAFAFKGGF